MSYLNRANELFEEAKNIRRKFHQNAEVGFELPKTLALVAEQLDAFGIAYEKTDGADALVGTFGNPEKGKTLLFRADMDALPMKELSGLPFASENGNFHAYGHDMHAASLLIALKMLKDDEEKLAGQIKFLFQPAEETLNGGKLMLEKNILENPKPDAGMSLHMQPNGKELGIFVPEKEALASALNFRIKIKGKGAHGATPYNGIDPVFVGSQIINAANGILARELPSNKGASLSMGYFDASNGAVNIVPESVTIEGTSRSLYAESAKHVAERLPEVVEHIGKAFRAETEYSELANVPSLVNSADMSRLVKEAAEKVLSDKYSVDYTEPMLASDDYAHIASRLAQSCYFFVSCPLPDEAGNLYPLHNPKVRFNEEALIVGPASMTEAASRWLKKNCD